MTAEGVGETRSREDLVMRWTSLSCPRPVRTGEENPKRCRGGTSQFTRNDEGLMQIRLSLTLQAPALSGYFLHRPAAHQLESRR